MYGNYSNPQFMIDRLTRQKEEIDNLIRSYQNSPQQTPVNNFISTNQTQTSTKDLIEWRVLNENEEVDNLYVANKTLFINDSLMILKGVDGSLEKWEIKKIYPVDKKDEKINQLEEEVKKLKEMINNEHSESTITTRSIEQSDANAIRNDNRKSKTSTKSVPTEE